MFKSPLAYFVFAILFLGACRKDASLLKDPGTLGFSKDTIYFDTVFTRLPGSQYPKSVNKRFMVRNPYKEKVNVNVRIMGGSASAYKMNVDGLTGREVRDVEIRPEDSAWVFVEATLDANNQTNPILVRDSIEFETNGNKQYVQLAAYGWDAYYFKDTVFSGTTTLTLKDKPYVIVNSLFVDEGATLNIGPGLHFYNSTNSVYVDTNNRKINISTINVFGTLNINGTKSEPVIFEGDRLDNDFQDVAGQWKGIHYYRGSINNTVTHALIKNAGIGLWVDSLPESGQYNLIIKNSIIRNMSAYGVLGLTASIYMENSLISNCAYNTFLGYYGGLYVLNNCTLYTGANGRRDPHVIFNNILRDANKNPIRIYDLQFQIRNSILWGPLDTEIGMDIDLSKPPSVNFEYNLYKIKGTGFAGNGNITDKNKDPKFVNVSKYDFHLGAGSPAIGAADINTATLTDLEEKSRDGNPDMGAYEF